MKSAMSTQLPKPCLGIMIGTSQGLRKAWVLHQQSTLCRRGGNLACWWRGSQSGTRRYWRNNWRSNRFLLPKFWWICWYLACSHRIGSCSTGWRCSTCFLEYVKAMGAVSLSFIGGGRCLELSSREFGVVDYELPKWRRRYIAVFAQKKAQANTYLYHFLIIWYAPQIIPSIRYPLTNFDHSCNFFLDFSQKQTVSIFFKSLWSLWLRLIK